MTCSTASLNSRMHKNYEVVFVEVLQRRDLVKCFETGAAARPHATDHVLESVLSQSMDVVTRTWRTVPEKGSVE